LPIKTTRIEQAIAEDVAFLAAHPTRRSGEHVMIRQKVKAAMRCASGMAQRLADYLSRRVESAAPRRRWAGTPSYASQPPAENA